MSKIRKIVIAAALTIAAVVPLAVAEAMPVTNVPAMAEKSSDVQKVGCGRWRCGYRHGYRYGHRYGYRHGYRYGYRYGYRRYWGPRVVIAPRVVVRSGYSRHVRWCLNNYQSYDVDSNTFVTYDGDVRRCRSPFN